ncbi:MAG: 4Fe-4S binding protein [Bacteroidales bacterium]|jgi:iron only hydrogenase large subunit-like protein|nr:4Fe-4S binding protein [Bacteroidales bacterium]
MNTPVENFHHALQFKYDLCIGCSHCTGVCPTGAIHVDKGRPILDPNRCIDCGRCFLICPVNAIYIEQDDFQTIYNYKCPVLLVPSLFSAQFHERINQRAILSAIYNLGFKYIFEVEKSVEVIKQIITKNVTENHGKQPIISTFCPAIVRLIQVKFPSLINNLFLIKPPLDLTALYIKKSLTEKGYSEQDIGIFYVAPCAAKIAAIKSPVGEEMSPITGVINMNYFYNKVLRVIKQGEYKLSNQEDDFHRLPKNSLLWALTGGEISLLEQGRNLAVDEVHNVSDFLEKLENEELEGIDFLELRACDESCAGGILCAANRFLIAERQRNRAKNCSNAVSHKDNELLDYVDYLTQNMQVRGEIQPRSIDKLDDNMAIAMRKMKQAFELNAELPQVDCRICGYQTCKALADAIVRGDADLKQCIFIQRMLEQTDKLTTAEALKIMKSIWGEKKVDINLTRHLNLE